MIEEALSRFRLDPQDKNKYQLVKLSLDSGRGETGQQAEMGEQAKRPERG